MKFQNTYSRILVDNHITEDDPSLMIKFDPAIYVKMIKQGAFEAAMVYATCHNGNSYYPTDVGHMHGNLKGRDIFGETVALLRENHIVPVAYHTVIFQRRYALDHPDWRMTFVDGRQGHRRAWYNCPNNSAYLEFAQRQVAEIVAYDIDAIFIDMTFWPGVCMCHSCRDKFRQEYDREIPQIIDWTDENWVTFQRARLQWLRTECGIVPVPGTRGPEEDDGFTTVGRIAGAVFKKPKTVDTRTVLNRFLELAEDLVRLEPRAEVESLMRRTES